MKLHIVPVELRQANAFIESLHRHHKPVTGWKFGIGIADETGLRGVATIGRPVARLLCDGWTLEVNRCCTDGVKNGCSMLYGAARRICRELGFKTLITYTLPEEGGVSLRASGWKCLGETGGGSWNRKNRHRLDQHPTQAKIKWEVKL